MRLRTISAAAFADDLIALASTGAGMQLISDVVSAFTIVFGFDIRVDKLRTLFLQWGTVEKYVHEPTLTVRTGHWANVSEVKMKCDGGLKFVGIVHNDRECAQYKALICDLRAQTLYLRRTRASIDCTLLTVNCSINNALLYRGTLATWTPAQYLELDLILGRLYRTIYKLQPGTAGHLLYMPTDQCVLMRQYLLYSALTYLSLFISDLYTQVL